MIEAALGSDAYDLEVFTDLEEPRSLQGPRPRPFLQDLRAAILTERFDLVAVEDMSCITRKVTEAVNWHEQVFHATGTPLVTLSGRFLLNVPTLFSRETDPGHGAE